MMLTRAHPRVLALLAVALLLMATPLVGQIGHPCGDRDGLRFAVVLDASSSVRSQRQAVAAQYRQILSAFASTLCVNDRLEVYTFPHDRGRGLHRVGVFEIGIDAGIHAQVIADSVLEQKDRHTDFTHILDVLRAELQGDDPADLVVLITDGAFYPRSWNTQQDSTTLRVAFESFLERTRSESVRRMPLRVIGVGSDRAPAIDADIARKHVPAGLVWNYGGASLEPGSATGSMLLDLAFGNRFYRYEALSVFDLLYGEPFGVLGAAGYESPRSLGQRATESRLELLAGVGIEHLVFRPGSHLVRCGMDMANTPSVRIVSVGLHDGYYCSSARPSEEFIRFLHAQGVTEFAFRQAHDDLVREIPSTVVARHQIVVPFRGQMGCEPTSAQDYFREGRPWPMRTKAQGQVIVTPQEAPHVRADTFGLRPIGEGGCLIAGVPDLNATWPPGDYLLRIELDSATALKAVTVQISRIGNRSTTRVYRGGFPLPQATTLRLATCIQLPERLRADERLVLFVGGRDVELRPVEGSVACSHHGRPAYVQKSEGAVYEFQGGLFVPDARIASAEFAIVSDSGIAVSQDEQPIKVELRGYSALSTVSFGLLFSIGVCIQLWWAYDCRQRFRATKVNPLSIRRTFVRALATGGLFVAGGSISVLFTRTAFPIDPVWWIVPYFLFMLLKLGILACLPDPITENITS